MPRLSAIYLVLTGATLMSFVGLCIRLIDKADGFQILLYRSIGMSIIIMIVCCLRRKITPIKFLKSIKNNDLIMGVSFAFSYLTYVFSMLNTSIASTLFLLSITPILAGLIAWFWIGEKPRLITCIAMIVALLGVLIMMGDGLQTGHLLGNILALFSAFFFALALVVAKKSKKDDVLGGTFFGAFFALILGLFMSLFWSKNIIINQNDLFLSIFMGSFTIGLGIAFVTWATPFLPAAEVSLFVLLESILGPIWVWIFLNEKMTELEIIGGLVVLTALISMITIKQKE